MAAKFMKTKKLVIPFITLLIIISGFAGKAIIDSNMAMEEINNGTEVVIEYSEPDVKKPINIESFPADKSSINEIIGEAIKQGDDEDKFTSKGDILNCFRKTFNDYWSDIKNTYKDFSDTAEELELLDINLDGFYDPEIDGTLEEIHEYYIEWRHMNHPTNPYAIQFEDYEDGIKVISNRVVAYTIPVAESEHIDSSAQFGIGDFFTDVSISNNGSWFRITSASNKHIYLENTPGYFVKYDDISVEECFTDVYYERYVIKDLDVYESPSTDSKSLGKVKFNICIVCIREGFGEMEDWAQAIGYINGEKFNGYVQREYLSESKIVVQQPVQQKPSSNAQKPSSDVQKPVEQKPVEQKPVEQKPSSDAQNQSGSIPGAMSWEDFASETSHVKVTEENIKATQEAVDRTQGTLHPN